MFQTLFFGTAVWDKGYVRAGGGDETSSPRSHLCIGRGPLLSLGDQGDCMVKGSCERCKEEALEGSKKVLCTQLFFHLFPVSYCKNHKIPQFLPTEICLFVSLKEYGVSNMLEGVIHHPRAQRGTLCPFCLRRFLGNGRHTSPVP